MIHGGSARNGFGGRVAGCGNITEELRHFNGIDETMPVRTCTVAMLRMIDRCRSDHFGKVKVFYHRVVVMLLLLL